MSIESMTCRLFHINRKTLNAKVRIFILQRKDNHSSVQVRIQDTLIESSNEEENRLSVLPVGNNRRRLLTRENKRINKSKVAKTNNLEKSFALNGNKAKNSLSPTKCVE